MRHIKLFLEYGIKPNTVVKYAFFIAESWSNDEKKNALQSTRNLIAQTIPYGLNQEGIQNIWQYVNALYAGTNYYAPMTKIIIDAQQCIDPSIWDPYKHPKALYLFLMPQGLFRSLKSFIIQREIPPMAAKIPMPK